MVDKIEGCGKRFEDRELIYYTEGGLGSERYYAPNAFLQSCGEQCKCDDADVPCVCFYCHQCIVKAGFIW